MANGNQSGDQVRQHVRQMLVRLAALQQKQRQEQNAPPGSVDTDVEVEGKEDPPGSVGDPEARVKHRALLRC
jgi:hypothetical protein